MKYSILTFLFALLFLDTNSQSITNQSASMADVMRSNGKIYVVVAVVVTILVGLIIYLIKIEKNITALEKEVKQQ
jgi:uncharacterized membrane protein